MDAVYDQEADRPAPAKVSHAGAFVLALVTAFTLTTGGVLAAGGLGGWAGVCLAVGVGCLFALWLRGERP